jgi:hypothetical protein
MTDLLGGLIAVIIEAILQLATSQAFVKAMLACVVYVFLFTIIPALILFLVPSSIMNALPSYVQMLEGGAASLVCSGTANPVPGQAVTCSAVITVTQFGQGVEYILQWFQFPAALGVFLPVLAVAFLFRRI